MEFLARPYVRRFFYTSAVLVIAFGLAHTPPAKRAARWLLEKAAARLTGGELALDALDYRLWRGELRATGVTWGMRRPPVSVRAPEVRVDFSLFAPPWIRVDSPEVRIEESPEPEAEAGPVAVPTALLGTKVEIRDGRFELGDLRLGSIDFDLEPEGLSSRGSASVATVVWRVGSTELALGPASGRFTLRPTTLEIEEASLERGLSQITASGRLSSFSPLAAEIRFTHRLEPDLVRELVPRLSGGGVVEGSGDLRKSADSGWSAEGTALAPSVAFDAVGPLAIRAPWSFENGILVVNGMEVEGYGGRALVDVELDSATDALEISGSLDGVDVSLLAAPVASRASGRFEARSTGFDFDRFEGAALVTLRPAPAREGLPLSGDVRLRLASGRVDFEAPRLSAAPGLQISSSGSLDDVLRARFRARLRDVSDQRFFELAGLPRLPVPASGALVASGAVAGPLDDLAIEATIESENLQLQGEPFTLDANARFRAARLRVESLSLRHEDGGLVAIEGEAPVTERGGSWSLSARVERFDVSWIAPALLGGLLDGTADVTGAFARPELSTSLVASTLSFGDDFRGRVRLSGRLVGPIDSLEGQARATVEDVNVRGVSFDAVALELDADAETARLRGRFVEGPDFLSAELRLESPYPLEADVPLESLPFAEIRRLFPALEDAGTYLEVEGRGHVALSLLEPRGFRYRIDADRALGTYRGIFLGASSPFSIEGDRNSLSIEDLILVGEDTAIGVDGVLPLSRDGGVVLHARGATRLELLRPWLPEAEPAGRANLDVRVEGALPDPWLRGELSIDGASARIEGILVENVTARGDWSEEALRFEDVRGELLGGRFRLRGELPPRLDASAPTRVLFEVEDLDPLRLAPEDAPWREGVEAEVALSGVLEGAGFDPSAWRGQGALGWVFVRRNEVELGNDAPAPWSYLNGRLELSGLVLSGGEGRLVIDAEARPFDDPRAWNAHATGRIDHSVSALFLQGLQELGVSFSGATDLDVRAGGGKEPFFVQGRGRFDDARLVVREPAIAFTSISGEVELDERSIRLTRLAADAGGGRVEATGTIFLGDFSGERTEIDFRANARSVRLTYPEGLRSEVNGDVRLHGAPDSLRLTGDVVLARALFSRDINIETEILQSLSRVSAVTDSSAFASSVLLDLRVRAGEAFRIDNNLARMEASVNLAIRGTLAAPEIHGIAAARPGGEFRFGGNTYRVETGRIQLRGYPAEPPVLDIRARTQVSGYDIQLVLRGPTDGLATELTALGKPPDAEEPSRADIASLLLTGRTLDKISSEGRSIVGERMASYLGGTLADLAELGIGETLPFDIVTVEPSLIAREADPSARFTLGARFEDALSLVYSIGLNDTDDQIWIVDYELPRRARTQLIRDADNEFTVGLSQSLRFDVRGRDRARDAEELTLATVEVSLRGDEPPISADALRERVRTRPRDGYDYWKAWDEAERLRKHLRSMGHLEARVEMTASPAPGANQIDLDYVVDAGPRVDFVWEGDELEGSLKKDIVELWTGSSSEAFLTADVVQLAEGELYEKRYYGARVEAAVERVSESQIVVTVALTRGPRGKRVALDFQGNESIGDSILLQSLPRPSTAAFHELVVSKRPRLKQTLQVQYASRGFVEASIGDPELSFDETSGVLDVVIPVVEGRLFRVAGIDLDGVETLDEGDVRARLSLREGDPFRVTSFVQDRSTLASFYRERGFPDVEVSSSILDRPEPGALGARYVVREGPRVTVGDLAIEGNVATRDSVIRRELAIQEGEPLRPSGLTETQRRLYELGIFQSADVIAGEPGADPSTRPVRIEVREAPDVEVDYGFRVATDGTFQVLGEMRSPNLFGRAQNAGFRALIGSDASVYRFTYRSPYLSRFRLTTDFFVEREIEEMTATEDAFGFADRTWTFTGQQTRALAEKLNLQWSYSFRRTVTQIDDPQDFGDFTFTQNRAILTAAVIGDSRNSVIRPARGSLWSVTLQGAPETLGSDLKFVKLFGQLYTFFPLGRGAIWAGGYRFGAADSFGQRLTEDDRFQAGGPNSVRGFETGTLGPIDDVLGRPLGGSGVIVFNQELRFPLFWKIGGVGFWDAGNAFATASEMSLTDLRHSVGAGLRLELPFGLLRLDWASVVDRRDGEDPWQLIFSLGHAF